MKKLFPLGHQTPLPGQVIQYKPAGQKDRVNGFVKRVVQTEDGSEISVHPERRATQAQREAGYERWRGTPDRMLDLTWGSSCEDSTFNERVAPQKGGAA